MAQKRYFLRFSYDGTKYAGWQIQPNATTVQEVIEKQLSVLLRTNIETLGAGRTDAGVHAREMYCHFDVREEITDTKDLILRLNKTLPFDIAVQDLFEVRCDAHARFDATFRTYEYVITKVKDPFLINKAYFFNRELDIDLMNKAAKILFDHIDFTSFSKANTQVFTNNCTVTEAYWRRENNLLIFTITANRFLRNMVRAIVGTLMNIGLGKISIEDFKKIIEQKNRSNAGESVAACGLYLIKIAYPENIKV